MNGTAKREVVDVFRKGKFELSDFSETELKGMGRFHGVR